MVSHTPKGKAAGSTPVWDIPLRKCEGHFFHVKDDLRIFHFEPITKISQLMPLAEFSVPANKIGFPANEAP